MGSAKNIFISQLGACTRSINSELKKTIIQVKAVDTGWMKNQARVKVTYNFVTDKFFIQESDAAKKVFYYLYVDQGTIHMKARKITDKTLRKPKVQKALDKLFDKWMDYMIDRQFETTNF